MSEELFIVAGTGSRSLQNATPAEKQAVFASVFTNSERRLEREYEACSTELRRQFMYEELTTSEWLALQLTANTTYFAQRRELSDRFYAQLRSL